MDQGQMRKVVRYLGKILSPVKNTVTSDLSCCCGCLCCNLNKLTFTLNAPSVTPYFTGWSSNVIQDSECPYVSQNPPNVDGPGSAYSMAVTKIGSTWYFGISLYCDNVSSFSPSLTPIQSGTITEVNGYPSGTVEFAPLDDPKSNSYDCKIRMKFDGTNTVLVTFSRVNI